MKATRNKIELELDSLVVQRGENKGQKYYGINFVLTKEQKELVNAPETVEAVAENLFIDRCQFIGFDIAAAFIDTAINTKMRAFNTSALTSAKALNKELDKLPPEQKEAAIQAELRKNIENWSMREATKSLLQDEMKAIGDKIKLLPKARQVFTDPEFLSLMMEVQELMLKLA